jgi:hypothetical protein|tara:strand:- start:6097 stop:6324 length:228 start_codon:yes stop_codon:yes gene_type:complete
MPKFYFRLDLGDLVSFKASRVTEEYIDDTMLMGIIIEQRYVFTADNKYKVRAGNQDYWVGEDKLTLLSKGPKNKT